MTNDTKFKLRAVFLAAMMFLWLFAGTVAFAGGAAAQFDADDDDHGDASFASEEIRWQGQMLYFEADDDGGDYALREVDSSAADDRGPLIREFSLDANDFRLINTQNLEGDIALRQDGEWVNVDSDGVQNGTAASGSEAAVEIAIQDIDTEFADDEVGLNGNTTLDIDSNRGGSWDLVIEEENLTQSELANIFSDNDNVSNVGDDAILIGDVSEGDELNATFDESDVNAGDEFTFELEVEDTTASDTASISIGEEVEGDAEFGQSTYTQERGDVVTFDLEVEGTDAVNVTFGGDNINYEADLMVEPNDDGEVVIQMNTWLASRTDGGASDLNLTSEDVFTAQEGSIEAVNESRTDRNRVLDAGLYDLIVEQADTEDAVEFDVSVVNLEDRSTDDFVIHTHPHSGFGATDELDTIYERIDEGSITESDEIAIALEEDNPRGDGIVHRLDASGIFGLLGAAQQSDDADADSDTEALAYAIDEGLLSLTIEQTNPGPNEDPTELEGLDGFTVVPDDENNTVFVNVRSDNLNLTQDAELGDEYNVTFEATDDFLNQFLRSANQVDEGEEVSDEFELVDREAAFDTVNGEVRVPPAEGAEITGETTVAPGTDMTVRTRATGDSPFLMTSSTTVEDDGSFAAEFDFSDVSSGQEFTASIQRQSFDNDVQTDGVVMEEDFAEVEISDQEAEETGDSVTVDRVYVPQGGFVTIHDDTLLDGEVFDSVRGTSDYLDEGEHTDVEVMLDEPYDMGDHTVIAMPHMDTNDNEEYDFVESEGAEDGPYTDEDGEAIVDDATLSVVEEETPTPTPEDTPTPTPEPMDDDGDDEPPADDDDQTGFGAVIALIALLAAALIAARRHSFDN